MKELPCNPDDPAFLLSRSLDEALSAADLEKLDRALAASASLREEAERLRALDGIVKRWGARPPQLDWHHHAELTAEMLAPDTEADKLDRLDRLLGDWAGVAPTIDEKAFAEAVMTRVRGQRKRAWQSMIFRIGVPLAAAAAIMLALTARMWVEPRAEPAMTIELGPLAMADSGPAQHGPVVVFGGKDEPPTAPRAGASSSGVSFMAIGVSRVNVGTAMVPP